jgi:acetyltransferase-like isoleucine patch superfamily enzyme
MNNEVSLVNIIGGSDDFVYELADVAVLLGMQPALVPTQSMTKSLPLVSDKILLKVDFTSLTPESFVFTGSDIHEHLNSESFPKRVLTPFRELVELQREHGLERWVNLIHPMAWLSPSVSLSKDVFIGANSSIGANSVLGSHVRINRNVSIGHNVTIEEGTEVAPCSALSSGASIGSWSYIGAGAVILNGVHVGEGATIGAGSVVTKDVSSGSVVMGTPARPQ